MELESLYLTKETYGQDKGGSKARSHSVAQSGRSSLS